MPHFTMRNSADVSQDNEGEHNEGLIHLTPEGLLPANQTLVLNPRMRTATLLSNEATGRAQIVKQQQFSPNRMRVLVPLLQAYPHYCPYEVLLASLFPLSLEECHRQLQEAWEMAIRPVRRAIGSIIAGLRSFCLTVYLLRGAGYLLKAL